MKSNYRIDIEDYVDSIVNHDMSDRLIKIMDGHLSDVDMATIGKYWEEMMMTKAYCCYHWMLNDPKLTDANEQFNKQRAWDMFPGLAQRIEKKHSAEVSTAVGTRSILELYTVSTNDLASKYTFKSFKWSVICFGQYYILEAYFPH